MGIKKPNTLIVAIVGASCTGRSIASLTDEPILAHVPDLKDPFDTTPTYTLKPTPIFDTPVELLPTKSMCPKEYGMMKQRKKFRR